MFAAASKTASSSAPSYIEDVFSTYLYAGTAASLTINNGIDLSGKGGAVWGKNRTTGSTDHWLYDTVRGFGKPLTPNSDAAQADNGDYFGVKQFNNNGFDIAANDAGSRWNSTSNNYVTWTFREQPKFFDVVTYTGNGSNRTIAHNLGSVPGCIIVKKTSGVANDWQVYHQSLGATKYLILNGTIDEQIDSSRWNNTSPTSTVFSLGGATAVNANGESYVAYLFANNAGGFGAAGTDNVITCGSYVGTGAGTPPSITLGYEPQWIMIKAASGGSAAFQNWNMFDNMRGLPVGGQDALLLANLSDAEVTNTDYISVNATGFQVVQGNGNATNQSGTTYIYIAIRRGPMKTPTTGASVFEPAFSTANSPEYKSNTVTSGFDTAIAIYRPGYSDANFSYPYVATRMQPTGRILQTSRTDAEYNYSAAATFAWNTGWFNSTFGNDTNRESYMFKRAPSFHDVVCYTGAFPSNVTVTHNLGVTPEFIITKARSTAGYDWRCYHSALGIGTTIRLNLTNAASAGTQYVSVSSTNFVVGNSGDTDNNGTTYVSYLFASCPGVSKVGSYTGTGSNQTIDCGFPSGVRFVLIKRTDTTGDWYVYDTTRGMTSGTDPYILLNSTAAEVTGTNYVETIATGFRLIGSNAGTNANGGTYIYLAIS